MGLLDFLSKPLAPEEDVEFLDWYSGIAEESGISSDPDDPRHYYDYRAAYESGASLNEEKHLPSEFKHDLHPNRFVVKKNLDIYDTKYEVPAKLEDIIMQSFKRKDYEEELFN